MNTPSKKSANAGFLVNQALLRLVKQNGEASYSVLFEQFGDVELSPIYANSRFANKLVYLCQTDQLQRSGFGRKAVYALGPLAFKSQPGSFRVMAHHSDAVSLAAAKRHEPIDAVDSYLGHKALPNQYNVMAAPTLGVQHGPVLRPGALDFKRVASHGYQC